MVTITFPDRETEKRALAFLLGRFSGRVLSSGEHLVPEAALEALADQNILFTVKEKTTVESAKSMAKEKRSFLQTAKSLNLQGPPDWSARFEEN